ncbi:hypothetical protein NC652_012983 [Populus alba x Populus x berolinensis]|uniref:Uncharacterized protein n=1 Tax=Populus alba x Populus x berolinensis TaxID=444605 RepID=A0AAD6W2F4_9ROSI|nr:hypothetical protein NC652_012976 [Populus alba x Populus x berolinensis]KAJ6928977.1 hypothetical protein NC652_012983 [Populus alba x Populus x berolinensis]KAJ6996211.1 hypothetical protein NC653_012956 [Populus alba x Populus x berolinensis]
MVEDTSVAIIMKIYSFNDFLEKRDSTEASLQTGCFKWMAACLYGIHSQKVLRAASHFSVSINTRRPVSPPIV